MKNKILMGTILVGMLSMGQAFASANSLQNSVITGTYSSSTSTDMFGIDFLSSRTPDVSVTALDSTAPEFLTGDLLFVIDFSNSGLVTFSNGFDVTPSDTYTMTFDFAGLTENISGFTLANTSTISGTPSLSLLNDHKLSVDLSSVNWGATNSNSFTAQLSFAPAVPEASTTAMLMLGLGVLGLVRRKRSV